jgi:hypothetical protein
MSVHNVVAGTSAAGAEIIFRSFTAVSFEHKESRTEKEWRRKLLIILVKTNTPTIMPSTKADTQFT